MDSKTLLALAQNAVDLGNITAACEFYELALAKSPNSNEVLELYAEIMIHYVQDIPRAKQMLCHSIEISPNCGYVKYLNLAQLSEGAEALQCYNKAYEIAKLMLQRCRKKKEKKALNETLATICCASAELYLTDLCYEQDAELNCMQLIRQSLEHNPNGIETHQVHASLLLSQNNTTAALDALRRAVDLTHRLSEEHQPTYESKIDLGRLLMQASPDEAFPFLLEVLQLGDNNPYVWFLLGECARLRKRYADSARLLRRARVMLVASDGDLSALQEVDKAISILVEDLGGPEEATKISDMDCINPIELLQPEDETGLLAENEDADLDEPQWESSDEDKHA